MNILIRGKEMKFSIMTYQLHNAAGKKKAK
jgi:hypothetical protein